MGGANGRVGGGGGAITEKSRMIYLINVTFSSKVNNKNVVGKLKLAKRKKICKILKALHKMSITLMFTTDC